MNAPDGLTYQQWISLPATDPRSPLYIPPNGFYQNDGGQLVPNSQANTPTPSATSQSSSGGLGSGILGTPLSMLDNLYGFIPGVSEITGNVVSGASKQLFGISLEDWVIIVVGLVLIAAGLFAFKTTQTVVTTVGRAAKRGAEIALT